METSKNAPLKDKMVLTGLILIAFSTIIFLLPEIIAINKDAYFGFFFFNYAISLFYFITLVINSFKKFRWSVFKNHIAYTLLLLILFVISAFALNREIPVFEQSVQWVCIYLVTQCITIILLVLRSYLPSFSLYILNFLLGGGIAFYIYFAVYLFPLYVVGLFGSILIGISLHVFTPLLLLVFTSILFIKNFKANKQLLYPFLLGIVISVSAPVYYIVKWQQLKNNISYVLNETVISETTLPMWVKLSQRIPKSIFFERMLKADLVYSSADESRFWEFRMPQTSFDEVKKHDPLVMMAALFIGKPDLEEKEKIKILESIYDSRHQAQERFWRGDKLETVNVISNVSIFPEFRLAYTEKVISIRNNQKMERWGNEQEAIYTFHLPEGGVVTSLSLWINGKEEKGIITTKSKADSAYREIVNVQKRDPSVIHWQEGNTVSVRIFPCTPKDNRRFKIGVTAPLHKKENQLIYENIYFDGPSCEATTESIQVKFQSLTQHIALPFKFSGSVSTAFKAEKYYDPYWEINFDAPAVSNEAFCFSGSNYRMEDYKKMYEGFVAKQIYLDINSSWSKDELLKLWERIKNQEVYVYHEKFIKLTKDNMDDLFTELNTLNFSIFPIHKIHDPATALLISKSTFTSPALSDLAGSDFLSALKDTLKDNKKIRLFNLGYNLSPYLKTLKEFRIFIYDQGNLGDLIALTQQKKYVQNQENDSTVVNDNAGFIIKKTSGELLNSKAPDHLLRLFAYNHIMGKISGNYFTPDFINAEIIAEAQKAYVVSPASSLIVLETQKDYDKFGIEQSKDSLKNASMKSSGAVPEPHEWLLIILTLAVVIYLLSGKSNLLTKNTN